MDERELVGIMILVGVRVRLGQPQAGARQFKASGTGGVEPPRLRPLPFALVQGLPADDNWLFSPPSFSSFPPVPLLPLLTDYIDLISIKLRPTCTTELVPLGSLLPSSDNSSAEASTRLVKPLVWTSLLRALLCHKGRATHLPRYWSLLLYLGRMDTATSTLIDPANPSTKRKRSTSPAPQPPPTKVAKTHSSHLQINYLTRQYPDILPLIASEDSLPSLLSLIQDYDGVLQRHESMAGNLGARPLGPILIKRFERLFESPPKVLKTHKEGMSVGWLDVVEFARNKPEQFNLEKTRDGHPVCQFYTKQCRVEITEEDYELIASGMPQKLIPPQPILEDEEKELGTLEILEKNLGHIVHLADSGKICYLESIPS